MFELIDLLESQGQLSKEQWVEVIEGYTPEIANYVFEKARALRETHYGKDTYLRGLIEFTNYCKQDCYYCGIRKGNKEVNRYRLSNDEIYACCAEGYQLGFRTFVLQGGEDPYYTDERLCEIVTHIKANYPDCAITLSLGERSYDSYLALYEAGADRYLLRHETACHIHYHQLHPADMRAHNRQECLRDLKAIGYQVGTGFMVGSPYQTAEQLAEDMLFIKTLDPQMVGIGPFLPHHETPFKEKTAGTLEQTLYMLGLLRLMIPKALLPATTSLGTAAPDGREQGVLAGANVVMPNLSPTSVRKDYLLYDNKICTTDTATMCRGCMEGRMQSIGYQIAVAKGDSLNV